MKFNDIYSEASFDMSPQQKMLADIGRLLMDYAETIKDPKDEKALTLSDEIGVLGGALADGRIRSVEQLLKLLPMLKSDEQEIANVVQQVFADYKEGKRSDLATKIKHDGTSDDEENDLRDGNEFADMVNKLKAQGAEPGTKFKTSDGKEHVLTADIIDEGSSYQDGISVIQHLEGIVRDKQTKAVPFADGKGKVDMFSASAVTKVFDALDDEKQRKMLNMIGTRTGFLKIAKFAMEQVGRTESMGEDNHDPSDHGEYAEREMAESQLEFIKYACEEIDEHLQQFPMPEWFQNKLSGVHETMTKLHAYIEGQEGKMGLNDSIEEGKKKGGKDGKACWDGYYLAGTKMKGGKEVDDCRPRKKPKKK